MSCPSAFTPHRWHQIVDDAGCFLDQWGQEAAELGWDAASVFGVDASAPEISRDRKGLVALIRGWTVNLVEGNRVVVTNPSTGSELSIYHRTDAAGGVMLWEIGG